MAHFILLGITFTINIENTIDNTLKLHITKMRNRIGQWSKSDLALFGIDAVFKYLVLSSIAHVLTSPPPPPPPPPSLRQNE